MRTSRTSIVQSYDGKVYGHWLWTWSSVASVYHHPRLHPHLQTTKVSKSLLRARYDPCQSDSSGYLYLIIHTRQTPKIKTSSATNHFGNDLLLSSYSVLPCIYSHAMLFLYLRLFLLVNQQAKFKINITTKEVIIWFDLAGEFEKHSNLPNNI